MIELHGLLLPKVDMEGSQPLYEKEIRAYIPSGNLTFWLFPPAPLGFFLLSENVAQPMTEREPLEQQSKNLNSGKVKS